MTNISEEELINFKNFFDNDEDLFLFLNNVDIFKNKLLSYNAKYNLIGDSTINNFYTRHILDSLQLVSMIDLNLENDNNKENIIDFGSGSGIPGIIVGIYFNIIKKQNRNFLLIEKSKIKSNFLDHIIKELNIPFMKVLNSDIYDIRFENIIKNNTIVISRAFKSIFKTIEIINSIYVLKNYVTKVVFLKGEKLKEELLELENSNLKNLYPNVQIVQSITKIGSVVSFNR